MRAALAGAALVALACASRSRPPVAQPVVAVFDQSEIRTLVRRALEGDASMRPVDSLFTPGMVALVDGRPRTYAPRFAGLEGAGALAILSMQIQGSPSLAWALASYRAATADGRPGRLGQATVILERGPGGWRISHIHSSVAAGATR